MSPFFLVRKRHTVNLPRILSYVGDRSGEEGTTISVSVNSSSVHPFKSILVDWTTVAGSAVAGVDFTAGAGTLSIPPSGTRQPSTAGQVPLLTRAGTQGPRGFAIEFSNARLDDGTPLIIEPAVQVVAITVTDADSDPPSMQIMYAFEGAGYATFLVRMPDGVALDGVQVGALATQTDVQRRYGSGYIELAAVSTVIDASGTKEITAGPASSPPFAPVWPTVVASMTLDADGLVYTATLGAYNTVTAIFRGPTCCVNRVVVAPVHDAVPHPVLQVCFYVWSYSNGTHKIRPVLQVTRNVEQADVVTGSITLSINGSPVYTANTAVGGGTLTTSGSAGLVGTFSVAHGLADNDTVRVTSGPQAGTSRRVDLKTSATKIKLKNKFPALQVAVTWQKPGFAVYNMSRPLLGTFLVGAPTFSFVRPDFEHTFFQAGIITPFLPTISSADPSPSSITGSKFSFGNFGDCEKYMPNVGDGPPRYDLGFQPEWTARYLVHRTRVLYDRMIANTDCAAGAFSDHLATADGMTMINPQLFVTPWFHLSGKGAVGTVNPESMAGNTWRMENAHLPDLLSVPYICTADPYYLDEMNFWAHQSFLGLGSQLFVPLYQRRGHRCLYLSDQVRGMAWGLRSVINAWYFLPDSFATVRAYLLQILQNNLDWFEGHATNQNSVVIQGATVPCWEPSSTQGGVLEWLFPFNSSVIVPDGTEYGSTPLSNLCYLTYMLTIARAVGLSPTDGMLGRIARLTLWRFTSDPDYNRGYAGVKEIAQGANWTTGQYGTIPFQFYTSKPDVFQKTFHDGVGGIVPQSHSFVWPFPGYMGPYLLTVLYEAERRQLADPADPRYAGATDAVEFLLAKVALQNDMNNSRSRYAAATRAA